MKKFEIDHLTARIKEVVLCTNGVVATKLRKSKKGTGLTNAKKLELIAARKATLKGVAELHALQSGYRESMAEEVLRCFEYPTTETQKEKLNFNKTIDRKIDEIQTEIELEGKRLLDRALLGIIAVEDIPDALHALGSMSSLANK